MAKDNKNRPEKVQVNARIFASQKKMLRQLQLEWGYSSLDRTLREVLRQFRRLQTEKADLLVRLHEANQRSSDMEQYVESFEHVRWAVQGFQDFKVDHLGWDRELARAEMSPLGRYIQYLRTGTLPGEGPDQDDDEDFLSDEEEEPENL